jgi:hypothetical protein
LKASPITPTEISALTSVTDVYEALPRVNKRGSEQDRKMNQNQTLATIQFKKPSSGRMPFWIALDEVQDPQVFSLQLVLYIYIKCLSLFTLSIIIIIELGIDS